MRSRVIHRLWAREKGGGDFGGGTLLADGTIHLLLKPPHGRMDRCCRWMVELSWAKSATGKPGWNEIRFDRLGSKAL